MTHKLITTENYLLVVDDSEIKEKSDDWFYSFETNKIYDAKTFYPTINCKRIIAHLPINNSPILECVDLLPPLEDEAEKLAEIEWKSSEDRTWKAPYIYAFGFTEGYNKAKAKYKYTEEDVIKIVEKSRETGLTAEYLMLSLQQPKMPVGFKYTDKIYKVKSGTIQEHKDSLAGYEYYEWVGRYIY